MCALFVLTLSQLAVPVVAQPAPRRTRLPIVQRPTPPPIGSGPNPTPRNLGDQVEPPPVPSGQADPTTGSIFDTQPLTVPPQPPSIYVPDAGVHPTQAGPSQGIMESRTRGPAPGAQDRNDPNPYPWVGGWGAGPRWPNNPAMSPSRRERQTKMVYVDAPINGFDLDGNPRPSHPPYPGWQRQWRMIPMPTVQKFGRSLVIAGVVFACVMVALASFSLVCGHPDAGQRVVATGSGLMLLLAAYTIYKIVMVNAFQLDGPAFSDRAAWQENRPQVVTNPDPNAPPAQANQPPARANTPSAPVAFARGRQRSNMPVQPLGASVNR